MAFQFDPPTLLQVSPSRRIRLLGGWMVGAASCSFVMTLRDGFTPWLFMWLLVTAILLSCKLLTWLNLQDPAHLRTGRLLGYFFLWPGMRPQPFLTEKASLASERQNLWAAGLVNLFTGLVLFGLALFSGAPWWAAAWIGMASFSFLVHFGAFDLLAVAWRRAGVPVEELFVCPIAARSLADFWGNRWNRAFSAFARDLLFRPVVRTVGPAWATLFVFVFSGLVHELVISVPAGGGYGGPMLYFLIQGILVLLESSRVFRERLRRHPMSARLWTAVAVLAPVPLLFHRPFLHNVVLPFLAAIGG
jgi:hypothetical protein